MTRSAVRACLRIAGRDARRARGRSALILAMVALPVAGMTSADVLYRTSQLDPHETVARELGRADVVVIDQGLGFHVAQNADATSLSSTSEGVDDGSGPPEARRSEELARLVPGALRAVSETTSVVLVRTRSGERPLRWRSVDYSDPMLAGMVTTVTGRLPRAREEVALTTSLADSLRLDVGSQLAAADGSTYEVVGTVRDPHQLDMRMVIGLPGAAPPSRDRRPDAPPRTFVDTADDVTWHEVLALNAQGVSAVSRAVVLDPPPPSEVPGYDGEYQRNMRLALAGLVLLVVGLATLEVVLLAGAAFAVGTRRQRRSLALVAVAGGNDRHVRGVVLAGGALLGASGAVVGIAVGVVTSYLLQGWFERTQNRMLGHFDVEPAEMLAIALVGTLTGLLAAVVPARGAARADVVGVLAGRAGTRTTPLRVPAAGIALVALGLVLAASGQAAGRALDSAKLILAGTALVQVGALVLTPALVGASGRLARHLPLLPRLALRDAARHRGRTAPAVGAVMAAVAGSTALAVYLVSDATHQERTYTPTLRVGTALVQFAAAPTAAQAAEMRDRVAALLPTRAAVVVRGAGCNQAYDPECTTYAHLQAPPTPCPDDGSSCAVNLFASSFAAPIVGDPGVLGALLGRRDARLESALTGGKAVVFQRGAAPGGVATYEVGDFTSGQQPTSLRLPAVEAEPIDGLGGVSVLPPSLARGFGTVAPVAVAVDTTRMPTADEEESASAALRSAPVESFLAVERGYRIRYGGPLLALLVGTTVITLGASGIATGLAAADGRADLATLGAVGAAPRTRRLLAGAQALTVSTLGTVLGVAIGFVPAVAYISRLPGWAVIAPWQTLGVVVLVVPALAALLAIAMTRSRLPMARRAA